MSSQEAGEWCPGEVFLIMGKPVRRGARVSVRIKGYKATIHGTLECYEPVRGYIFIRTDGDVVMVHIKDVTMMTFHGGSTDGVGIH